MTESTEIITIRGRYFWKGDERFQIKGVVYQPKQNRNDSHKHIIDPLCDEHLEDLERSIPIFQDLGLNALFIYSLDNGKNHDKAMELLSRAGIYVLACLSTPQRCINRHTPDESYNSDLLREYFKTIDCMAAYPNTLGLIVASSVINMLGMTNVARFIRALARDVKTYMSIAADVAGQRVLPIGVSSSGLAGILVPEFEYMTGGRQEDAVDFFSFNNYMWCGESSMQISGYDYLVDCFTNTHVPVCFSGYGTNIYRPRTFHETRAIYSPEMTGIFSGAFVYQFFEGANMYGLVKVHNDSGIWERLGDFWNLKKSLLESCTADPVTLPEWSAEEVTLTKRPAIPERSADWRADSVIPRSPMDWDGLRLDFEDRQWVDVEREMRDLSLGGDDPAVS